MRRGTFLNLIVVVAFAVFCVGGIGFLAVGMGMQVPGLRQGWRLEASFAQADGLVSQADVDLAGVKVGKVLGISQQGGDALVSMQIDPQVHLRTDVRAYVRPKSLIGEKYVQLVRTPGSSAPQAPDGFHLPAAQTGQAIEIDAILNSLDPQTRSAMSQSLRELGVAVSGQSQDINQSIPQVEQVASNLRPLVQVTDRRQQELDRILIDLAIIMQALADEQNTLGQVVDSGSTALGAISQRDQDLAGTVQQANKLLISLDSAFKDLTPADRASLQKAPGTIQSGQTLLSQLNPIIDRLLPEILLAQINYPNNQLNVSDAQAVTLAQEWLSAFSQRDSLGHSFRITPVMDLKTAIKLPVSLPSAPAQSAGPPVGQLPGPSVPGQRPAPVQTQDASGEAIPAVMQMLLGLPS
jgi:phospholipid/cholesterol/gamma-HCH transport system substrate-binding protein